MHEVFEFFKKTGAQGGKKRAENLSKAELTAIGKKGAEARWGKKRKKPLVKKLTKGSKRKGTR